MLDCRLVNDHHINCVTTDVDMPTFYHNCIGIGFKSVCVCLPLLIIIATKVFKLPATGWVEVTIE